MSDVAIVTANFGGYDEPRGAVPQEGYEDADWFLFHDRAPFGPMLPAPWQEFTSMGVANAPRLAAKPFKLTPWAMGPLSGYRWIVWLDANMEVTSPTFLREAIAAAEAQGAPVMAWRHPRRTSAAAEVAGSLIEAPTKYEALTSKFAEQLVAYNKAGFPDDLGLWACGTLVWNMGVEDGVGGQEARTLGEAWLRECEEHTIQDQVSLPFVAWKLGVPVGTFPVPQIEGSYLHGTRALYNRWLRIWPHNRED